MDRVTVDYSEDEPEQCVKYEDEACWGCGECDKD